MLQQLKIRLLSLLGASSASYSAPFNSRDYWEKRYQDGRTSGAGSYGRLAEFKAEYLNAFVQENEIKTVIELGCGDGNQLSLAAYPSYIGFDVSPTILRKTSSRFSEDESKSFKLMEEYSDETADLSLSLDVVYHLLEDETFANYMRVLFHSSSQYVIIYSSNRDGAEEQAPHVRHRHFTSWVEKNIRGFRLIDHTRNRHVFDGDNETGSFADFYVYKAE